MAVTIALALMALMLFGFALDSWSRDREGRAFCGFILSIAGFVLSALHLYGVAQ